MSERLFPDIQSCFSKNNLHFKIFVILPCVIYLSIIIFTKTIAYIQAKVLLKKVNKLQLNLEIKHRLVAVIKNISTVIQGR